jgi:hypothetical protein
VTTTATTRYYRHTLLAVLISWTPERERLFLGTQHLRRTPKPSQSSQLLSLSEPVRPGAASPDRALCLPTFSHFVIVNKTSLSLSLSPSLSSSSSSCSPFDIPKRTRSEVKRNSAAARPPKPKPETLPFPSHPPPPPSNQVYVRLGGCRGLFCVWTL